jgi:hypothetical protein
MNWVGLSPDEVGRYSRSRNKHSAIAKEYVKVALLMGGSGAEKRCQYGEEAVVRAPGWLQPSKCSREISEPSAPQPYALRMH